MENAHLLIEWADLGDDRLSSKSELRSSNAEVLEGDDAAEEAAGLGMGDSRSCFSAASWRSLKPGRRSGLVVPPGDRCF